MVPNPAEPHAAAPAGPVPSAASAEVLQQALADVFAPWVRDLDLSVLQATQGQVTLALPVSARHVHGGGVLCGQTLMAAADTAMVLAVMTHLGSFKPMTTVQLQTSFLRPVPGVIGSQVRIVATVLRMGRQLVFGEVQMLAPDERLAAHTTTTYALL
jgi:uncharacterized protein (TIGR00369 family)